MICIQRFLITMIAFVIMTDAATYYVSTSQSNGSSGTSETTAWQTLAYASSKAVSGDRILLKCGDVFRESGVSISDGVTLSSYGSGPQPVVSGAIAIAGWTAWAGHSGIYYASVNQAVENLFINGKLMLIARYPNSGWLLTTSNDASSRVVTSTDLAKNPRNTDGYWNTCRMRWRHWNWYYDTRIVANYAATGTLTLGGTPVQGVGNGAKGWGFYMDGKLTELDTAGEWFYDAAAKRVYLFPPVGVNISSALVEGMAANKGISVGNASVQGICFRHYMTRGMDVNQKATIEGCSFYGIGSDSSGAALALNWSSSGSRISRCKFQGNLNVSISIIKDGSNRTETLIENDTILTSGTVPGYGGQGSWHGAGIVQYAGNTVRIRYCRFDSTGYAAILFGSAGNTAEYNFINHAMATMVDGGGIYTNCDSTTFRRNIIINTIGSWEGSPFHLEGGAGIWPEFLSHFRGQRIEYNTLAYNHRGNGIFLPNNFHSVIKGNVCYDNAAGMHIEGGFYTDDNLPLNDSIVGNVFYTIMANRQALTYRPEYSYGVIAGNYYCNPGHDNVIGQYEAPPGNVWNCVPHPLAWWQTNWPQADKQAKTDPIKRAANAPASDLRGTSRLVYNDDSLRKTIALDNGVYVDLDNKQVSGSITLDPFSSIVLVHTGQTTATGVRITDRGGCGMVQPLAFGRGFRFTPPHGVAARVTIIDSHGRTIDAFVLRAAAVWTGGSGARRPAAGVYLCALDYGEGSARNRVVYPIVVGQTGTAGL